MSRFRRRKPHHRKIERYIKGFSPFFSEGLNWYSNPGVLSVRFGSVATLTPILGRQSEHTSQSEIPLWVLPKFRSFVMLVVIPIKGVSIQKFYSLRRMLSDGNASYWSMNEWLDQILIVCK